MEIILETLPTGNPLLVEQSSDEMLMRRIASGNQLAMRTLVARYQVRLYRFLVRNVGGNPTLAEDLLSDIFFDVWRQAVGQFRGQSSLSSWLLTIAHNKARKAMKQAVRREAKEVSQADDEIAYRLPDPSDNPEVILQKNESSARLRRCVAKLCPEHAEVIDLVYYHGKSIKEVAEIMNIPAGTVKSRMSRAREVLRSML